MGQFDDYQRMMNMMQQQSAQQNIYGQLGLGQMLGSAPTPPKESKPEPDKALLLLEEEDATETV